MKNSINFLFWVVVLFLFGTTVSLLAQSESLETKMFFSSRKLAEKAFNSGNFRYYQPNPKNLRSRPPFNAKGLPSAYIVLEEVRENAGKSPAWILLASGTPVVFNIKGVPIRDGRCWNKIMEAYPISSSREFIPLSMLGQLQVPGPPGDRGPRGFNGKDGRVLRFNFFYYKNLLWEIPIVGIIVWGIIKILTPNNSSTPTGQGPGGNTGPAF